MVYSPSKIFDYSNRKELSLSLPKSGKFARTLKAMASVFASKPSSDDAMEFRSAGVLTLGVEMELQLIDEATLHLAPKAEELLKALGAHSKIKAELRHNTEGLMKLAFGDAFKVRLVAGAGFEPTTFRL